MNKFSEGCAKLSNSENNKFSFFGAILNRNQNLWLPLKSFSDFRRQKLVLAYGVLFKQLTIE